MFQFIWGSCQEYVKREVMYKPLEKGGKAVPELGAKLNALFLSPILNAVLNEKSVSLWMYFAKFWVGSMIFRKMGQRLPLHIPHAEIRPTIYERAMTLLRATNLEERQIRHVHRSTIERSILPRNERLVPVGILPETKCIQVWKNVNSPFLFNTHKD